MGKWQIGTGLVFLTAIAVVLAIIGHPVWIIPCVILGVVLLAYAGLNWSIVQRQDAKHGDDVEAKMSDNEDPIPASHLILDDGTPAGDTPEAHDELSPHDVPLSSPMRETVEAQAGGDEGEGTTRGNEEGGAGGEAATDASDDTAARTGEPQRSASQANS